MRLILVLDSVLLLAIPAFTLPSADEVAYSIRSVGNLARRMDDDVIIKCGDHSYDHAAREAAFRAGADLTLEGKTIKSKNNRKYPEPFENREKLDFGSCNGPFIEFPILRNGKVFKAKADQGKDRFVYEEDPNMRGSFIDCGLMTHEGASKPNGFVKCKEV